MEVKLKRAIEKIEAGDPATISSGLAEMETLLPGLDGSGYDQAIAAVAGLFYTDPYDLPDFKPAIDKASELLAAQGRKALKLMIRMLSDADLKFVFNVSRTLGRMGTEAIDRLIHAYEDTYDTSTRAFIIYAIGKIRHPVIAEASALLVGAALDPGRDIRDSAVRAIGKIAEFAPATGVDSRERKQMVEVLKKAMGDEVPAIRAKAVRSMAKMASHGYLTAEQRDDLAQHAHRMLGHDEAFNWDLAYIVRKEAEFALKELEK